VQETKKSAAQKCFTKKTGKNPQTKTKKALTTLEAKEGKKTTLKTWKKTARPHRKKKQGGEITFHKKVSKSVRGTRGPVKKTVKNTRKRETWKTQINPAKKKNITNGGKGRPHQRGKMEFVCKHSTLKRTEGGVKGLGKNRKGPLQKGKIVWLRREKKDSSGEKKEESREPPEKE